MQIIPNWSMISSFEETDLTGTVIFKYLKIPGNVGFILNQIAMFCW